MNDHSNDQKIKHVIRLLLERRKNEIELKMGIEINEFLYEPYIDRAFQSIKSSALYKHITGEQLTVTEKTYKEFENGIMFGISSSYNKDHPENKQIPKDVQQLIDKEVTILQDSFLLNTNFIEYKIAFSKIIIDVIHNSYYNNMTLERLSQISKDIPKDETLSLSQLLFKIQREYFNDLKTEFSIIDHSILERFLKIYDDCFKCLEKFMKISLYDYYNIIKNTKKSFDNIINRPAHCVKLELINLNSDFENLLKPFKTIVWNALKHGQVIKLPSEQKIRFVSNIKPKNNNENITEVLTYMELSN